MIASYHNISKAKIPIHSINHNSSSIQSKLPNKSSSLLRQNIQAQPPLFIYQFPSKSFLLQNFTTPNEITKQLNRLGIRANFWRGRLYIREDIKTLYWQKVIFKCKQNQCKAKMIYGRKQNRIGNQNTDNQKYMRALVFDNLHKHKRAKDESKLKRQQINMFILHLRGQKYEQFRKIKKWVQKFELSRIQAVQRVNQLYWNNNTQQQTLTVLSHQSVIIRRITNPQISNQTLLIYLCTPAMLQNYRKYGETLTIELYYQKIMRENIGKNYAVGFMFGEDAWMRVRLFGVFVIVKEVASVWKKLFEIIFEIGAQNKKKCIPNYIIAKQNHQLMQALNQIKAQNQYKYTFLIPQLYAIQKLTKIIQQSPNPNPTIIIDLFTKAMKQPSQNQYYNLMCQLKTYLNTNHHNFEQLRDMQKYCCLRRIGQKYIGSTMDISFSERIVQICTDSTVYRVQTGRFFNRLLKIQNYLQAYGKNDRNINEIFLKFTPVQINILQYKLSNKTLIKLITAYQNSTDLIEQHINPVTIQLTQPITNKKHTCTFLIEFDHWQCSCQELIRTGLPCSHLICVLYGKDIGGALEYYVNSRWIVDKGANAKEVRSSGKLSTKRKRKRY